MKKLRLKRSSHVTQQVRDLNPGSQASESPQVRMGKVGGRVLRSVPLLLARDPVRGPGEDYQRRGGQAPEARARMPPPPSLRTWLRPTGPTLRGPGSEKLKPAPRGPGGEAVRGGRPLHPRDSTGGCGARPSCPWPPAAQEGSITQVRGQGGGRGYQ